MNYVPMLFTAFVTGWMMVCMTLGQVGMNELQAALVQEGDAERYGRSPDRAIETDRRSPCDGVVYEVEDLRPAVEPSGTVRRPATAQQIVVITLRRDDSGDEIQNQQQLHVVREECAEQVCLSPPSSLQCPLTDAVITTERDDYYRSFSSLFPRSG